MPSQTHTEYIYYLLYCVHYRIHTQIHQYTSKLTLRVVLELSTLLRGKGLYGTRVYTGVAGVCPAGVSFSKLFTTNNTHTHVTLTLRVVLERVSTFLRGKGLYGHAFILGLQAYVLLGVSFSYMLPLQIHSYIYTHIYTMFMYM
jgi:hypothetical protein